MIAYDVPAYDVAIVGCGPVGQLLAILLGQRGYRVAAIEKYPRPYGLPRAVHFDDEIARIFALAGIGDDLAAITEPATIYEWQNAAGQTLLRFDWSRAGDQTWPFANMFSQPDLEALLERRMARIPSIDVRRCSEAIGVSADADGVNLEIRDESGSRQTLRASYLVGCDGANSFVRGHMQTTVTELGFFYDWLIVDVILNEPRVYDPINLQICDPVRPVTAVSGGPGRRRWEFMRLPHETKDELNSTERAWQLLARFDVTPANARLVRHTVYTFAARWADRWRNGRVLIAGDAAHLMPPFAGQGMCSGMRDAANLAWKLDLVLAGTACAAVLDTYGVERSTHVQNAIGMSVALGNVICLTDATAAAGRDAGMIAAGAAPERILPPIPPAKLGDGIVHRRADGSAQAQAGTLAPQGRVAVGGAAGRFDSVVGTGFAVIAEDDPLGVLDLERREFLSGIGAHVVRVVEPGTDAPGAVTDRDSVYAEYLTRLDAAAIVIRPDFYLFGAASTMAELPRLIDDLRAQLTTGKPADGDTELLLTSPPAR